MIPFQDKLAEHNLSLRRVLQTLQFNDCDFYQMLGMQLRNGRRLYLWDIAPEHLEDGEIMTSVHCLACTAGCGNSCTGALAN